MNLLDDELVVSGRLYYIIDGAGAAATCWCAGWARQPLSRMGTLLYLVRSMCPP
jgi:hypothetical protein